MTNPPTNRPPDHEAKSSRRPGGQPGQQRPLKPASGRPNATRNASVGHGVPQRHARGPQQPQQELLVRKRKRRHTKRKARLRTALIVLGAIVLIGGGTALGVMAAINAGGNAVHEAARADDIKTADDAVTADEGKTVKYDGHTYALNDNMVSIAVIGYDRTTPAVDGAPAGQADMASVLALDTKTGKATVIVVPRDSMVDVDKSVGGAFAGIDKMQICLAYGYGDGREGSCENTTSALSRVLYNMPLSYYFALDLSGVGPLSDAAGGVALTPLQSIPDTSIVKGQNTVLFGDNALSYVRWRDTSELNSSLDRQARQVQYIKALASQSLKVSPGDLGTLINLFNTANQYSITNLGFNEFSYLATSLISNGITDLNVVTLPGQIKQGKKYAEFYLDKDGVYKTVLDVYYHQVD